MRRELYLVIPIAVLFLLSACTGSQPEELQIVATATPALEQAAESEVEASGEIVIASEDTAGQQESEHEMEGEMADQAEEMADDMAGDEAVGADRPAWQQLTLTNARTGETFTLADFGGQTVFVEPMATWCSNCRR
ncbi:MAG: hypothetical protein AMJ56_13680, partial [Anaerolineae bacterium SG8_19]